MKICVITDRRAGLTRKLPQCDFALFGFGALGGVDYGDELSGKSDSFERVARLSGASRCGVMCACVTDSRGLKRRSVAVASGGRLLGITDMLYVLDGEIYKGGATLGVYQSGGYKVGVCIQNDLYFPEVFKSLSMCGCNLVTAFCEDVSDGVLPVLIRAYAYLYGVPVALCGNGAAYFADVTGVIAGSNRSAALFETVPQNNYRIVTERRRGIASEDRVDY